MWSIIITEFFNAFVEYEKHNWYPYEVPIG